MKGEYVLSISLANVCCAGASKLKSRNIDESILRVCFLGARYSQSWVAES